MHLYAPADPIAADLILQLTCPRQDGRLSADKALEHAWFNEEIATDAEVYAELSLRLPRHMPAPEAASACDLLSAIVTPQAQPPAPWAQAATVSKKRKLDEDEPEAVAAAASTAGGLQKATRAATPDEELEEGEL